MTQRQIMTAQEMFENLGFSLHENYGCNVIAYHQRYNDAKSIFGHNIGDILECDCLVVFDLDEKGYLAEFFLSLSDEDDIYMQELMVVTPEIHAAIHKQMEELNWI